MPSRMSFVLLKRGLAGFAISLLAYQLYWLLALPPVLKEEPPGLAQQWETAIDSIPQWQVDPATAANWVAGGATVLDARGKLFPFPQLGPNYLPGAIAIDWRAFSAPAKGDRSVRGRLHPENRVLTDKLQALGIDRDVPVIVVGAGRRGWGEEGRIVWMLRSLGHERVVFVDGGYRALAKAVRELQVLRMVQPSVPGDFVVRRSPQWTITKEELRDRLSDLNNIVILDARSPQEFQGATPYGEQRGGHIPGARSLHFRETLGPDGRVLPRDRLQARLQELDIKPTDTIVSYCTGGVRSAWLTAILVDMGYDARNYAGSMWEWSAGNPDEYPLER